MAGQILATTLARAKTFAKRHRIAIFMTALLMFLLGVAYAIHEAAIDPNYQVFSWDDVFSAWHIQNRTNNSRVEVIHDRGLTKIIRYD